jgi:hypothetical protein
MRYWNDGQSESRMGCFTVGAISIMFIIALTASVFDGLIQRILRHYR